MKLIVGLGNPGKEYENTRHNMGFRMIDYYLKSLDIIPTWSEKFNGYYFQTLINGDKVLFIKPKTFMNRSGDCVRAFVDYYNIDIDDILVISDDLDLNIGNYKLKANGSCGGHNGLRDIELKLNTSEYKRLKIGVSNDKNVDTKDYVLGNISKEDNKILEEVYKILIGVLNDYFKIDFGDLMSRYNRKNK